MKKVFFFLAITLFATVAVAQRFEWAKGYGSEQEGCVIKGSVVDGEGNLYILGNFRIDSKWDGQRLLPMTPYGYYPDNINVLIAKISPEGEMVWKKVIHCNNGQNALSQDIKKVGDIAFACLVQYSFPSEGFNYTYYLDTLLPTWSDYPCSAQGLCWPIVNSLITFDFDGNIIEQHMLYVTYVDNDGKDVKHYMYGGDSLIVNAFLEDATFDIDRAGNVYFCRRANDVTATHYNQDGISGIKFWSDRRQVGYIDVTNEHPLRWYPQLLKFSPHLDTLLASRYVVQGCDTDIWYNEDNLLRVDMNGNPFLICNLKGSSSIANTLVVDSVKNIVLNVAPKNCDKGFLVKFDTILNPCWIVTINEEVVNPDLSSMIPFHDVVFDYDSNLFFTSTTCGRGSLSDTNAFYSTLDYNGIALVNLKSDVVILALRETDSMPLLMAYAPVPSLRESNRYLSYSDEKTINSLVAKKGRVFVESKYYGGVRFPENTIRLNSIYDQSLGMTIFDYKLKVIGGLHFATSPRSIAGCITYKDSVLYLVNEIKDGNATFGDIHFDAGNGTSACVAKYVDSAFCIPYSTPNVNIYAVETEDEIDIYPNPANDKLYYTNGGRNIISAFAISLMGERVPLPLNKNNIDVSSLSSGVFIIELKTLNYSYHLKFIKL